jgi:F1F0 ATPase subunit 2
MNDPSGWVVAAAGGAALGLFYYAGLWLTLRRLPAMAYPGLWVFASFTVRLAVGMCGFYLILGPDRSLPRLGVALLAFVLVRVLLIRRLQPAVAAGRRPS